MIRSLAACALLALTVIAGHAEPAASVNLRDLHSSDPAAAAVLADRIQAAAEKVCGPAHYTADNRPSALAEADFDHRACLRSAAHRAMARVRAVRPDLVMPDAARTRLTDR